MSLFNIRNYLHDVSNIQRREVELNIILPRVNNFVIKQKIAQNICFTIYSPTSNKIKVGKYQKDTVNF